MKKRILSILLSAAMVLTSFSVPAFAAEEEVVADVAEEAVVDTTVSFNGGMFETADGQFYTSTVTCRKGGSTPYVYGYYYSENESGVSKAEVVNPADSSVVMKAGYVNDRYFETCINGGDTNTAPLYYNMYAGFSLSYDKFPAKGEYDIVLTLCDGTKVTRKGGIVVDDTANYVESVSLASGFDSTGDYIYLQLSGRNIDPSKLTYTFAKHNDTTYKYDVPVATTYVEGLETEKSELRDTWYIKLKKESKESLKAGDSYQLTITPQAGYDIKLSSGEKNEYVTTSLIYGSVFYTTYNFAKNQIILGITSDRWEAAKKVTVEILDNVDGESKAVATMEGSVGADGLVCLNVPADFKSTKDNYTIRYKYGDYEGTTSVNGFTYAYDFYETLYDGKDGENNSAVFDNDAAFLAGTVAKIDYTWNDYNKDGFDGVSYTAELQKYDSAKDGYVTVSELPATVADNTVQGYAFKKVSVSVDVSAIKPVGELEDYIIYIKCLKNGETIAEDREWFEVLPASVEKFYLENESGDAISYMYWEGDDYGYGLSVYSYQYLYGNNEYTVTIKDENKNAVEGVTATYVSGYGSHMYFQIKGLPKPEKDTVYYVKISNNKLGEAYTKYNGKYDEEKDEYVSIPEELYYNERCQNQDGDKITVYAASNTNQEKTEYFRAYTLNSSDGEPGISKPSTVYGLRIETEADNKITFPVTVTLYKPYDTTPIFSVEYKEADNDNEIYFGQGDIYGRLEDKDAKYRIVVSDGRNYVDDVTNHGSGYAIIRYADDKILAIYDPAAETVKGNNKDTLALSKVKSKKGKISNSITKLTVDLKETKSGRATLFKGSKILVNNVTAEPTVEVYTLDKDGKKTVLDAKAAKKVFLGKFNQKKSTYTVTAKGSKKETIYAAVKYSDTITHTYKITCPSLPKTMKTQNVAVNGEATVKIDGDINTYMWTVKGGTLNKETGVITNKKGVEIAVLSAKGNKAVVYAKAAGTVKLTAQYLNKKFNATVKIK